MRLQEIRDCRICLRSIRMEVKPVARLWHYISPKRTRTIEVRGGWLIDDTRAVAAANKKVVLAVNHLDTSQ